MEIKFFEDPEEIPQPREKVRFNQLGVFVHEDRRRVTIGFDITPFLERPSIEVNIWNDKAQLASSLSVIEAIETKFSLVMHLRDKNPGMDYSIEAELYYPENDSVRSLGESPKRLIVDRLVRRFNSAIPGDQTILN